MKINPKLFLFTALAAILLSGCSPVSNQVQVTLTEWGINLDISEVPAGEVIFTVSNQGLLEHNFLIEGTEIQLDLIPVNSQAAITVNLEPGRYMILCSLPGHEEAGMRTEFTVLPY
ncbi:MAG: cupredoxin domain-containing protein [Anaerolineae bacterium]|nr:cupredoxin domain-containing protein [Anaerolineae bacterium]